MRNQITTMPSCDYLPACLTLHRGSSTSILKGNGPFEYVGKALQECYREHTLRHDELYRQGSCNEKQDTPLEERHDIQSASVLGLLQLTRSLLQGLCIYSTTLYSTL